MARIDVWGIVLLLSCLQPSFCADTRSVVERRRDSLSVMSDGTAQGTNSMIRSEKKALMEISNEGATVMTKSESINCAALTNHGSHSTVQIQVGTPIEGTSPQKFDVVADTGSDNVIVPSCNCEMSGHCSNAESCFKGTNHSNTFVLTKFESNSSDNVGEVRSAPGLKEVLLTFGSGQIEAVVATDVVQLGYTKALMKDSVLLMVDQKLRISGSFNGILGLGTPCKNATSVGHADCPTEGGFLESAGVQQFSLCFNQAKDGVLRLDPPPAIVNKLGSIGTFHWGLDFQGISVGNETAEVQFCDPSETKQPGQTTSCGIIPDSGTTIMMGDEAHLLSLFTQICNGWDRCKANTTSENPPHYALRSLLADCSTWVTANNTINELPSLFFHVAGSEGKTITVEMTPHDYIMESYEEDVHHITKYLMGIFPVEVAQPTGHQRLVCTTAFGKTDFKTKSNGPVWIWGTPLFYKFQVQYDIASQPPSIAFVNQNCGSCGASESLIVTERQDIDRSNGKRLRRLSGPIRLPSFEFPKESL